MNLELRRLRYFTTLVEARSFRRAAQQLGVSQPAITTSLKKLEGEIGETLVLRTQRRFEVSPIGETVYAEAQRLLEQAERVANHIGNVRQLKAGRISLGIEAPLVSQLFAQAVQSFSYRYPDIEVSVTCGSDDELRKELALDGVNLVLGRVPWNPPAGLQTQKLLDDPYMMIAHPDHPLVHASSANLADFFEFPPLFSSKIINLNPWITELLRDSGFLDHPPAIDVEDIGLISMLLRNPDRKFVAHYPRQYFAAEIAEARLSARKLDDVEWKLPIGVTHRGFQRLPAAAQAFIEYLEAQAAHEPP